MLAPIAAIGATLFCWLLIYYLGSGIPEAKLALWFILPPVVCLPILYRSALLRDLSAAPRIVWLLVLSYGLYVVGYCAFVVLFLALVLIGGGRLTN